MSNDGLDKIHPVLCAGKNVDAALQSLTIGSLCPALRALPHAFSCSNAGRETSVNSSSPSSTPRQFDTRYRAFQKSSFPFSDRSFQTSRGRDCWLPDRECPDLSVGSGGWQYSASIP